MRPALIVAALSAAALLPPVVTAAAAAAAAGADEVERARKNWAGSAHGPMLERILPPAMTPRRLPDPASDGARLTVRYCTQCHHLPNPEMHTAERWRSVVDRMVWRMRGNGNMGALMKEMMAQVAVPREAEVAALARYLGRHGQKEIDAGHPVLGTAAGQMYSIACSQCHALPDPRRHTAREWPAVVERMKRHMAWTNVITGSPELRTVPELDTREIVRALQRHARADGDAAR